MCTGSYLTDTTILKATDRYKVKRKMRVSKRYSILNKLKSTPCFLCHSKLKSWYYDYRNVAWCKNCGTKYYIPDKSGIYLFIDDLNKTCIEAAEAGKKLREELIEKQTKEILKEIIDMDYSSGV